MQEIIDNHIRKLLADDIVILVDCPLTSPMMLCWKNNVKFLDNPAAWKFDNI